MGHKDLVLISLVCFYIHVYKARLPYKLLQEVDFKTARSIQSTFFLNLKTQGLRKTLAVPSSHATRFCYLYARV